MRYIILADISVAPRVVMDEDHRGPRIFNSLLEAEETLAFLEDAIIVPLNNIIGTLREASKFLKMLVDNAGMEDDMTLSCQESINKNFGI